jgi:hypothetical protein
MLTIPRNWPAIVALTDGPFRLVVATATDKDIVAGLAIGFPRLFPSEDVPFEGPWPLSLLEDMVDVGTFDGNDAGIILERLSPSLARFATDDESERDDADSKCILLGSEDAACLRAAFSRLDGSGFPHSLQTVEIGGATYYVARDEQVSDHCTAWLFPCDLVDNELEGGDDISFSQFVEIARQATAGG